MTQDLNEPQRASQRKSKLNFRRELWELSSQLWTLPLSVEWHFQEDMAFVRLGHNLQLLTLQRAVASALLDRIGERTGPNRWRITRGSLQTVACLSNHTDPEAVVRWEYSRPHVIEDEQERENGDSALIYEECVKAGLAKTPESARVIHRAWCKVMLHCLVNLRLPVNLLFCRLHSLPFRVNWQTMVLKELGNKPFNFHVMIDSLLFAWRYGRAHWHVHVEHLPMWHRMIASSEDRAGEKAEQSRSNYLAYLNDVIKHLRPRIERIYEQWTDAIAFPNLRIISRDGRKLKGDFPTTRSAAKKAKRRRRGGGGTTSITARAPTDLPPCYDVNTAKAVPCERVDLPEKAGNVPPVSGIRPAA